MDVSILINKAHPLPENFRPDGLIDLFSLEERRFFLPPEPMRLYGEAALALNRMCAAAEEEAGLMDYLVYSAWRSREEQMEIYASARSGYAALPGCSEHESGLAIDIDRGGPDPELNYIDWLEKNSWRFGFILRYPRGREHITGIPYEPWHYRYVGEELALALHENGWTLEEYYDRSIVRPDPYDPAYIFRSIFGSKMKGHWQTWPEIDLEELRKVNPATVGWVHMDGTAIDYPIVGPELNRGWCLSRNFSGEPSAHGMIQLARFTGTEDLLLNGHHMKDTSMFMKLDELREAGSFDAHPMIELYVDGVRYTARWFAAVLLRHGAVPSMPASADPAVREKWLQKIREKSVCASDTVVRQEDRILACSTCTNHPDYQTTVLYAVLRPFPAG